MPVYLVYLKSVINVFLILLCIKEIRSPPINNRFSMKFNPLLPKEEIKSQSFGAIFAKIPQELKLEDAQELLSKAIFPQVANLGFGSTNQIAKIIFPTPPPIDNSTELSAKKENKNVMSIPIIPQPFKEYKIIVATAPNNIRVGKGEDAKPVVIYVVFPDNDSDPKSFDIPSVYFITKPEGLPFQKKKDDPILVVDSNRTVTGLRSKAMAKFVTFKNKMTNQYETH